MASSKIEVPRSVLTHNFRYDDILVTNKLWVIVGNVGELTSRDLDF